MGEDKNNKYSASEKFTEYLSRHNKRRTAERFAILDCVMSLSDHFSVENLGERLEQQGFHVSRTTLYSTVELLSDCGLVRRHRFDGGTALYERIVGDSNHHHLICSRCGKIKEVRDASLSAEISSKRYAGFAVGYYSLNIYGLCRTCQKRSRKKARQTDNDKSK